MIEFLMQGVALGALYALIAIPLSLVWMTAHSLDLAVGGYAVFGGLAYAAAGGGGIGLLVALVAGAACELADKNPGVEIVATTSAPLDASDLSAQAARLRNAKPDAVFVAVSATGLAAGFLRAADGVGLDLPHFGGMSLAQDAIVEASGEKAAEGFTVANMIDGTNLLDNQTGLYEMLKKHDVKPAGGFPDIGGASAASMIIAGLRHAGPDSKGPEIVEAWETGVEMETFTKIPGAYGPGRRHAHTTDVLLWTTVRDGVFTGAD